MEKFEKLLNFSLINIDKPAGPTSFSVSEFVKRQLKLKKTSHMGTLDPKVTGVLPITLGRACKLAGYFIKHDKGYVGILHTHGEQDIKKLQKLIDDNFIGLIKQIPPHKSAVKRAERERKVYEFKFLEKSENGKDFLFSCKVEGGTYIRKICSDLGEMIGGAHMDELRRTTAGIFSEDKMYSIYDFEKAVERYNSGYIIPLKKMLISAEDAIKRVLPEIQVEKRAIKGLYTGKPLFRNDVIGKPSPKKNESFAAFCGKKLIGIYRVSGEEIIYARSEFVYN